MNPASTSLVHELRPKILERRDRLQAAARSLSADYVNDLLAEVDAALQRIDNGSYGLCETCHDPIEPDLIEHNPLVRFCLADLTPAERSAHEQDLELATHIQSTLLPPRTVKTANWETHYRYQPAGAVGGDYCEVVPLDHGNSLFFAVGDVTGKGVAASLLMTHLSAIFRSLLSLDLPLKEIMARANRLFCDSTPATHYATVVAGRATAGGFDLCNAGHCRPLVLRKPATAWIDSTGLPLGLFCDHPYSVTHVALEPGESLVMYTDGITEAQDSSGNLFDEGRLVQACGNRDGSCEALADRLLRDVAQFRGTRPPHDDITLLVVRRHS